MSDEAQAVAAAALAAERAESWRRFQDAVTAYRRGRREEVSAYLADLAHRHGRSFAESIRAEVKAFATWQTVKERR